MEEKIKRLLEWAKGNPKGPISIHLDPTNKCNLKCRFCWQRSHERLGWIDRESELSEKKLLSMVKQAAKLGVKDWLISGGGEPLARTDTTMKIMSEIKKYGMIGDIITNGTLGTETHFRKIVKSGWDTFRVSINAPNAEEHDFIVNTKNAFERATGNIKKINEFKEKFGRDEPVIGFNTVIQSHNYFRFPEIVELLDELNGKILNIQTIILYSDKEKKWSLNEEQIKDSQKYIKKALKIANEHGIRTNLGSYLEKKVMRDSTQIQKMKNLVFSELETIEHKNKFVHAFCFEPFYLMTIRANGIVGSCRLFGDHGENIHNKTLREIWFGKYFNNARKKLMKGKPQDFCSKCGSNEFLENRKIRFELMKRMN